MKKIIWIAMTGFSLMAMADWGGEMVDPPLPTPLTDPRSFSLQGDISPTIYYQPLLVDSNQVCAPSSRVSMAGEHGIELMKLCRKNLSICAMEGSCRISQNNTVRSFNVLSGRSGAQIFFELHPDECFFGFGVNSICLDPFYTVAADLDFYRAGDVIYVPALVGGLLPGGERHTGFLIVRDRGAGIHGRHRFDFFSGSLDWQDPENPFGVLKLSDSNTHLPYYKVSGSLAQEILQRRNYPGRPLHH